VLPVATTVKPESFDSVVVGPGVVVGVAVVVGCGAVVAVVDAGPLVGDVPGVDDGASAAGAAGAAGAMTVTGVVGDACPTAALLAGVDTLRAAAGFTLSHLYVAFDFTHR
jgi:hypothetical protein